MGQSNRNATDVYLLFMVHACIPRHTHTHTLLLNARARVRALHTCSSWYSRTRSHPPPLFPILARACTSWVNAAWHVPWWRPLPRLSRITPLFAPSPLAVELSPAIRFAGGCS
jgi:hypothetical protein